MVFEFWLKIFGLAFGLGVVSGIVMAFQFGTNWSALSKMSGPIQGPLLSYETFTAFMLEATFFGVLIFGRSRVPPWLYLLSTAMVALGTTFSAFWIMVNNSWMQVPVGYAMENGVAVPNDWGKIIFNPVVWVRFPHMLLAAYITGAFCVAATGAWYLLRRTNSASRRTSCCAWGCSSLQCSSRLRSSSGTSVANTFTMINPPNSPRSRADGTTSNPPARSCSQSRIQPPRAMPMRSRSLSSEV